MSEAAAPSWLDKPLPLVGKPMDTTNRDALQAALIGGGVGLAGVSLVRLVQALRQKPIKRSPAAVSRVPIKITPEQARQMMAAGMLPKVAGLLSGVMQGLIGTGAGLASWSMLDKFMGGNEKDKAKARIQRLRERIERTLSDNPDPEDLELHAQMKAAEYLYFDAPQEKRASALGLLGIMLGSGMALSAAAGMRETADTAKSRAVAKKIRDSIERRPPTAPMVVLDPYVDLPGEDDVVAEEPAVEVKPEPKPKPKPKKTLKDKLKAAPPKVELNLGGPSVRPIVVAAPRASAQPVF